MKKKIVLLLCLSLGVFTSCSNDDSNSTTVPPTDNSTIKTFKDVTFSLDESEGFDAGRFFSTELGKSFKKSKIDATILPKIDLAFYSGSFSLNAFVSPNNSDHGIKNATTSIFLNNPKGSITVDQFKKKKKSTDFDTLKLDADDNESFPDNLTPTVVLFKNAAGKKGAIHVKSVSRAGYDPRIVVDIKIQK